MAVSSTFAASGGDGYELQMGRWSRRLAPLFIEFAGIAAGERVLDVGCGTGSLTFALAQNPRIRSVEGIDFSPAYIEHARQHAGGPRPGFQVGDACALPFPDGSFDHTLSMLVLQFIPEAERAVREMRRVTRSGGTVAAATWDTQSMALNRIYYESAGAIDAKAHEVRTAQLARPMSRSEGLLAGMREAGLADVMVERLTISMDFASFADFWAPFEGRDGPHAQHFASLDPPRQGKVREMVEDAYRDGRPDGPRSYPTSAWAAKATAP